MSAKIKAGKFAHGRTVASFSGLFHPSERLTGIFLTVATFGQLVLRDDQSAFRLLNQCITQKIAMKLE